MPMVLHEAPQRMLHLRRLQKKMNKMMRVGAALLFSAACALHARADQSSFHRPEVSLRASVDDADRDRPARIDHRLGLQLSDRGVWHVPLRRPVHNAPPMTAPELDAASAAGALTLLCGSLLLLRSRGRHERMPIE
ncbi:MAG TPA: hypothetical protein VKT22_09360 [Steroidobacteraceae bacterium]|nr:hypothetical protein [Steroidobacteraceae bacterium]